MHTVHSDGEWTVEGLADEARRLKLDFIGITDHNTMSHHREINEQNAKNSFPLILRGEEVTTYGGHANAWGLKTGKWLDFRVEPGDSQHISKIASAAHEQGAVISINHPFALCTGCNWSYQPAVSSFDAIEVWNGTWDPTDEQALRWWDGLLQKGMRITGLGSSDSHRPSNQLGLPTIHVGAPTLSEEDILSGIQGGCIYVTGRDSALRIAFTAQRPGERNLVYGIGELMRLKSPGRIRLSISVRDLPSGSSLKLISQQGQLREFTAAGSAINESIELTCTKDSYYRLEARSPSGQMIAFTNPIYVKIDH
jgi:hypothetical protein